MNQKTDKYSITNKYIFYQKKCLTFKECFFNRKSYKKGSNTPK